MIRFYRLLFVPLLLVALPYYLLRMFRRGGYADGFSHRFGGMNAPAKRPGVKRIWIQAVSVGEIGAIEPLLKTLADDARVEVVLTTTTSTAYKLAREKLAEYTVAIGVFPLDFMPFNLRAWNTIRPDLVVLTEGELWPEHLHRAVARGVPAVLINARLSDRSFRRYQKAAFVARRLMRKLSLVLAGTESDLVRLRALGVAEAKSSVSGNLKCDVDVGEPVTESERRALFVELFGPLDENAPRPTVLLGSSTWPGDEAVLLDTRRRALAAGRDLRLLIVPRHAERRGELAALLKDEPDHYFRSKHPQAPGPSRIVVADTTGELRRLTRAADLAFIGKSLPPNRGGQTPIECALLGVAQVFGPEMSNFRDISRALVESDAARQTADAPTTGDALIALTDDAPARDAMRLAAERWAQANRGATARTVDALLGLLFGPKK